MELINKNIALDDQSNKQINIDIQPIQQMQIKEPKITNPFNGHLFAVYVCKKYDVQEYHINLNKYRYCSILNGLYGNEDMIFSANWIISDDQDVINFANKYNKNLITK